MTYGRRMVGTTARRLAEKALGGEAGLADLREIAAEIGLYLDMAAAEALADEPTVDETTHRPRPSRNPPQETKEGTRR